MSVTNESWQERALRLDERLAVAERHLGNILARLFRDGGQRYQELGPAAAVEEADKIIVGWLSAEQRAERLAKALQRYANHTSWDHGDWGYQDVWGPDTNGWETAEAALKQEGSE